MVDDGKWLDALCIKNRMHFLGSFDQLQDIWIHCSKEVGTGDYGAISWYFFGPWRLLDTFPVILLCHFMKTYTIIAQICV